MNRQRSPAWRFIWKKTALKDQIMNDPGSAREFQSVTREPVTQDYGGRDYTCKDPEGNVWTFGTYDPWVHS